MSLPARSFIIIGLTQEGKPFRPSDWPERLCGIMSAFGADHRTTYSPYVRPGCTLTGEKTVIVDGQLFTLNALAFEFLINFAKDNNLQTESWDSNPENAAM